MIHKNNVIDLIAPNEVMNIKCESIIRIYLDTNPNSHACALQAISLIHLLKKNSCLLYEYIE